MPSELSVCSGLVVELESLYFLQLTVELQTNLHQILYYKHFEDWTVVNLPFPPSFYKGNTFTTVLYPWGPCPSLWEPLPYTNFKQLMSIRCLLCGGQISGWTHCKPADQWKPWTSLRHWWQCRSRHLGFVEKHFWSSVIQREEKPHPSPGGVSFCATSPRAGEHLTQTGKDRIIIQLTKTFL